MKIKIYILFICLAVTNHVHSQEVVSTSFSASSLNESEIPLNIYLPQDYDADGESYPLYVFLHGCCGLNHQTHINDFATRLNQLIESGTIAPMIVVFPSAQGADFGNRHIWQNSERNGNYGDLIVEDLIGYVEANYNVSSTQRAIGGFSMGGDGALRLGLSNSQMFSALISHSSYSAIENFIHVIPDLISETGQSSPPYSFLPGNGLYTEVVFGVATAWSPNLDNTPYQVDFPLNEEGELRTEIFNTWKSVASPDSIIRQNWNSNQDVPVAIYFDAGNLESIFTLFETNNLLNTQLQTLVENEGYTINFKYNVFNENHQLSVARIDSSLIWLDQHFSQITTSNTTLKQEDQFKLHVFPNPVVQSVNISYEQKSNSEYHIELINASGIVLQKEIRQERGRVHLDFDLSNYESGVFQILIRDPSRNQILATKLVKL